MVTILQLPYTLFIKTGSIIDLELTKQAQGGPPASDSSVASFHVVNSHTGSGHGTQALGLT